MLRLLSETFFALVGVHIVTVVMCIETHVGRRVNFPLFYNDFSHVCYVLTRVNEISQYHI